MAPHVLQNEISAKSRSRSEADLRARFQVVFLPSHSQTEAASQTRYSWFAALQGHSPPLLADSLLRSRDPSSRAMTSAAARCLAVTELVEIIIDFACKTDYSYWAGQMLQSFRVVNRLWQQIAEKRIVKTLMLYNRKYSAVCRPSNTYQVAQIFERSPALLQTVAEVRIRHHWAGTMDGLSRFANLSTIQVENVESLDQLAAYYEQAHVARPRIKKLLIVASPEYEYQYVDEEAARFLQSMPTLDSLAIVQESFEEWQEWSLSSYDLDSWIKRWVRNIRNLSLSLACDASGIAADLTALLSYFHNCKSWRSPFKRK